MGKGKHIQAMHNRGLHRANAAMGEGNFSKEMSPPELWRSLGA